MHDLDNPDKENKSCNFKESTKVLKNPWTHKIELWNSRASSAPWLLHCLANYNHLKTEGQDRKKITRQQHNSISYDHQKSELTNNRLNSTPSTFHALLWQSCHPFSSSSGDHLYENTEVLYDQRGTKNQLENKKYLVSVCMYGGRIALY